MMSAVEVERGQPVALLGLDSPIACSATSIRWRRRSRSPASAFRVVGVSEQKGSFFGNSQDNFAVIPLGAYQRLFGARQSLSLMVKPVSTDRMTEAMDDATVARVARRLKPSAPNNFGVLTSDTILDLYRQVTSGIFRGPRRHRRLSLVVGGIVIMNIMLMVVSERTREIGLRKALGAKRKDIMSQVLTESITLSTFGGMIGILLGSLAATLIAALTPCPPVWRCGRSCSASGSPPPSACSSAPARRPRAASLDPIEALRRE